MPRVLGVNTNYSFNTEDSFDLQLMNTMSGADRSDWFSSDWYSQTFKDRFNNMSNIDNSNDMRYYCLDLSDSDMSDSPLKRFHQVTICGDYLTKEGKKWTKYKNCIITAQLPQQIRYNISGNYSTPFKSVLDFSKYNGLTSLATANEMSATIGLTTMSVWESPNPLKIQLTLSCLDDVGSKTGINTLEAINLLSNWALPLGVNEAGLYAGIPGPRVPTVSFTYNKYNKDESGNVSVSDTKTTPIGGGAGSTRLTVMIGGMLLMDYCILRSIDVNYPNTKAQYLHNYNVSSFGSDAGTGTDTGIRLLPVRCDLTLTFESVIGLTRTNFQNMLSLRDNSNPNQLTNVDLTQIQEAMDDQFKPASGAAIDTVTTSVSKFINGG